MSVWVVVPARRHARRLPDKPLREIGGRPLVLHVVERARAASCVSEVVLATDDDAIAEVGEAAGVLVVRTGDQPSGTHRCFEAITRLGARPHRILNVQGDQPLLDPAHLDALAPHIHEVATLSAPLRGDPADPRRVKVVTDGEGRALAFSRSPIPVGGPFRVHVGVYGFTLDALARCAAAPRTPLCLAEDLEQIAWLDAGVRIDVVRIASVEAPVDDEADLHRVRAAWAGARRGVG